MSEPPVDLVRRAMQAASAETAEYESSIAEVSALDHERVLVMMPTTFRFKASGLSMEEQDLAAVVTVRDGKIVKTVAYRSRAEALAALDAQS